MDAYQWTVPVRQHSAVQHWSAVVDPALRAHTQARLFRDGRLFIEVDTGTLRQELMFKRQEYRDQINQRVGEAAVQEIVFTVKS